LKHEQEDVDDNEEDDSESETDDETEDEDFTEEPPVLAPVTMSVSDAAPTPVSPNAGV